MKKSSKQDLLDLAEDVGKADYLEFFLGDGDRAPAGTRLTRRGQKMIEDALRYRAANDTTLKGE
jgi:hypothetical protein